jgi:Fe-S cluster assembly protein SufD
MALTTTDKNITSEISSFIRQRMQAGLDPVRTTALEFFEQLGLPGNRHEEYKYTPVTRELGKKFSFQQPAFGPALKDIGQFIIPDIEANVIVFINGVFSREHSIVRTRPSEMTIQPLAEALASANVMAAGHFNEHVDIKQDAFAAWNTAGWQDGIFLHVPDNTSVSLPVIVYYINDATAEEVIATHRNLVVVGKNSQLTLIEKFSSSGANDHFTNLVSEVVVSENAALEFYSLQNDSGNRYQVTGTRIYQKKASRVNTYSFNLQGQLIRNNLHLILDGEGIESHMYGLYLLTGNTLADNHTVVDHQKPNSFSNELYKGIMDGNSRGVFNGKIFVRPQAQKTNAFQANRNILLSEKATINTKPQLEIWADDVKCSHGCTTGQLDEEAMFYLRARGISKESARAMMLYAFAGEVVEKIPHAGIRNYVDTAIGERLHKNF